MNPDIPQRGQTVFAEPPRHSYNINTGIDYPFTPIVAAFLVDAYAGFLFEDAHETLQRVHYAGSHEELKEALAAFVEAVRYPTPREAYRAGCYRVDPAEIADSLRLPTIPLYTIVRQLIDTRRIQRIDGTPAFELDPLDRAQLVLLCE